jgi:hypothetical protein
LHNGELPSLISFPQAGSIGIFGNIQALGVLTAYKGAWILIAITVHART